MGISIKPEQESRLSLYIPAWAVGTYVPCNSTRRGPSRTALQPAGKESVARTTCKRKKKVGDNQDGAVQRSYRAGNCIPCLGCRQRRPQSARIAMMHHETAAVSCLALAPSMSCGASRRTARLFMAPQPQVKSSDSSLGSVCWRRLPAAFPPPSRPAARSVEANPWKPTC